MRISTTLVTISLLIGGLAVIAPAGSALDIGCVEADSSGHVDITTLPAGSATLFTPPGADVTGWTPECVVIPNGGSVTWTQRDGIGHGAVSNAACFDFEAMSVLGGTPASPDAKPVNTLTLAFAFEDELLGFALQDGTDYRSCTGYTLEGESTLVIPYHCVIHGDGMPGVIKVEL